MQFDEIKILIALTGHKRLPHLEKEIFANDLLSAYYLLSLTENCYDTGYSSACLATNYAWLVLRTRWPEAEDIIKLDANSAYRYSWYIFSARWPEAEQHIRKHPKWWNEYCKLYDLDVLFMG